MNEAKQNINLNISIASQINYLVYKPDNLKEQIPLILSLHGAGEIADYSKVKNRGLLKFISEGNNLNAIIVAPILQRGSTWSHEVLKDFLDHFIDQNSYIDRSNLNLTGYSLGALSCWLLLFNNPNMFKTVSVLCGSADPYGVTLLKDSKTKIWLFHGKQDERVGVINTKDLITALKTVDYPDYKYTIFDDLGHSIDERVYSMPELYTWMSMTVS